MLLFKKKFLDDIRRGTELWSRFLEDEIRKRPEQWVWFYPRWRSPPDRPRRHFLRRKRRPGESEDAPVPADSAESQAP